MTEEEMIQIFKPLPAPGDIVWCLFPYQIGNPGPKPRPALVCSVSPTTNSVEVAYGTSQKLSKIYPTELVITYGKPGFIESGLERSTKFDLSHRVKIPFNSSWFSPVPNQLTPQSPLPKLGVLHPLFLTEVRRISDDMQRNSGNT